MANSPKVPKLDFKKALALNGYTTEQLTALVCDLIRSNNLTNYETIPTDFMESISTVIDAIYMRRTKEGGLDKSCLSYPLLVEEYGSVVSEAELETLVKVLEQKKKKGDQTPLASKRVHKLYVEKEKKMIGKLVEAKLLPSDLTADDLSHSNNDTDKYCTNIIKIADKVLGYMFKTRDRDDVLKNIQNLIELCHGAILGRYYLSNFGKEVQDNCSVHQWERHSYVIICLTVLLAALDLKCKQQTGKHGKLLVKVPRDLNEDDKKVYLKALEFGKAHCNRSRIMVVGPAGVGKTSLIRRLTGQGFNPQEKSTEGAENCTIQNNDVSKWKLLFESDLKDELARSIVLAKISQDSQVGLATSNDQARLQGPQALSETSVDGSTIRDQKRTTHESDHAPKSGEYGTESFLDSLTQDKMIRVKSSQNDLIYNIWDFGGQVIYYVTHPIYMSWRSLYILLFDFHLDLNGKPSRIEESSESSKAPKLTGPQSDIPTNIELLHFWLMSIHTHAVPASSNQKKHSDHDDPKILLIGTFKDHVDDQKMEKMKQDLKRSFEGQPYENQIHDTILGFDNHSGTEEEIGEIRQCIDDLIKNSAYMKELQPVKWRTFSDEIASKSKDHQCMKLAEIDAILSTLSINNPKEREAVLHFYHNKGHIVYHQGCDLVVLDPQWLNSIISSIFTVTENLRKYRHSKDFVNKGVLHKELAFDIWNEMGIAQELHDQLLKMMDKFDLICEIMEDQYFVPCRSSKDISKKEDFKTFDDTFEFMISFSPFLPVGLLHRFYVKMAKLAMARLQKRLQEQMGIKKCIVQYFHYREMVFYWDVTHRVKMQYDGGSSVEVTVLAVPPCGSKQPAQQKLKVSLSEEFHFRLKDILTDLQKTWARRLEFEIGNKCHNPDCDNILILEGYLKCTPCYMCTSCFHENDTDEVRRKFCLEDIPSSSQENPDESSDPIPNELLLKIAEEIPNKRLYKLAIALGVKPTAKIDNYHARNNSGGNVTSDGTRDMLFDWRDSVSRSCERTVLQKALRKVGLTRIQDDHLPMKEESEYVQSSAMKRKHESSTSSTEGDPPARGKKKKKKRKVRENEEEPIPETSTRETSLSKKKKKKKKKEDKEEKEKAEELSDDVEAGGVMEMPSPETKKKKKKKKSPELEEDT